VGREERRMTEYIMKSSPILEADGTPLEIVGELIRCKDCAWHKEKRCTVWRERAVIVECYTDDEGYCYLAKEKDDV
jgi:hypothetical protein